MVIPRTDKQKYTHGNLSQRRLGPQGCPGIAHQPLGILRVGPGTAPEVGCLPSPRPTREPGVTYAARPLWGSRTASWSALYYCGRTDTRACLPGYCSQAQSARGKNQQVGKGNQFVRNVDSTVTETQSPRQITRLRLGAQTKLYSTHILSIQHLKLSHFPNLLKLPTL